MVESAGTEMHEIGPCGFRRGFSEDSGTSNDG